MKLDASKEFQNLTAYAQGIQRSADLIRDTEVLIDLVGCLAVLLQSCFAGLVGITSDSERTLLEAAFDKQLELHDLQRKETK